MTRNVMAYPLAARRSPPAGFILPAQPALVAKPRGGPEWIYEVKHDGYRLIARKEAGRVTLWSRWGTDLTDNMPRIAAAIRALPVADALLDGEAVVFRADGHATSRRFEQRGAAEAAFVAFDLLQIDGQDRRNLALEVRRAELESLVAGIDAITFSEAIEAEGAVVFAKACEMGLEGIVSKRLGGAYWAGAAGIGSRSRTRISGDADAIADRSGHLCRHARAQAAFNFFLDRGRYVRLRGMASPCREPRLDHALLRLVDAAAPRLVAKLISAQLISERGLLDRLGVVSLCRFSPESDCVRDRAHVGNFHLSPSFDRRAAKARRAKSRPHFPAEQETSRPSDSK